VAGLKRRGAIHQPTQPRKVTCWTVVDRLPCGDGACAQFETSPVGKYPLRRNDRASHNEFRDAAVLVLVDHLPDRRAMRELRERGLIVSVLGKGTFVAS
jgi:hypothetical protein